MGNQQECIKDDEIISNTNLNNVTHKKVSDIYDFAKNIHSEFDALYDKYNLSRDEAKRLKRKIFGEFQKTTIEGYRPISNLVGYDINRDGVIRNHRTRKIIKPSPNKKGYLSLTLGNHKTKRVHRCVAETFIPNPHNKTEVNHIDGNKLNNCVDNLEWVTGRENMDHGVRLGLFKTEANKISATGENNNSAKLTETQVREIRNSSLPRKDLADMYGVSYGTIGDIIMRRSWKHI